MNDEKETLTPCTWESDEGFGWSTTCGELFVLNEGSPEDNNMQFCCYCGKPLVVPDAKV